MRKFLTVSILVFCIATLVSCGSGSGSGDDDYAGVQRCGNGRIEDGETCDGDVACWKAGHFWPEGKAVCKSNCSGYDTSKCVPRDPSDKCGNFEKDSGEACEQGETKPCTDLQAGFTEGDATCRRDCRGWETMNCSKGGKNKPCSLILNCVKGCAGDANCIEECKKSGTDEGLVKYEDLEKCAAACGGVTDDSCLSQNCYDAYYTCNPTQRCGNKVLDEGEVCENKETKPCQELNTADQEYQPINDAVCNSECTGWDTYSCVDINALTCYQVYECTQECSDSNCEADCMAKTWPAAKNIYDTMMTCLEQNCPVVTDECINEFCKFQTDACKTHLTCGNGVVDNYEICDPKDGNNAFVDCGEIKDSNGEAMYEAGTGSAFCNKNCTEYGVTLCHKFCSCSEIKTCIETECGGYPKSNAENTDAKIKCMETCESWGNKIGEEEASGYRMLIESCCEQDQQGNTGACGWDSSTCIQQAPSQANATCGSGDDPKCPY